MMTLEAALPYKDTIIAVGLDSSEQGNPPEKFKAEAKKTLISKLDQYLFAS